MVIENNGISIPDQLSKDFFKKALENGLNTSNIDIRKISFTMGSSGGDNYCSQIFRAMITYSEDGNITPKVISLIVKYMPMDGSKELLKALQFYEREVKMYFDIIPELEELLDNKILLAPKCFYAVSEPVQTMVFQDLKASDYNVADRTTGLDEEHSQILLRKIAQFHAASMVLAKKNPDSIKFFNRSMFHDGTDSKAKDEIFLGNLKYMEKYLYTWPGFESIAKRIGKIIERFYEISIKTVERKSKIAVLNHGDLWINNFMVKKDNKGKPMDIVFVDLQISYWGSLGIDLNYFLNTSVQIDVLKSKRYELLRSYYASLKETLEMFNYLEIPSWDDVRKEILATEFYGFFAFQCVLPLIALDRETSKDNSFDSFDDAEKSQKNREIAFASKRLQETLKYSLDRFDELGVFDIE